VKSRLKPFACSLSSSAFTPPGKVWRPIRRRSTDHWDSRKVQINISIFNKIRRAPYLYNDELLTKVRKKAHFDYNKYIYCSIIDT
jgi:hypothetical protein